MVNRRELTKILAYTFGIALLSLIIAGCTSFFDQEHTIHLYTEDSPATVVAKMDQTVPVYTFSFDRRMDPAEDVKMYAPFLRYLEQTTGYRFKMLPMTPSDNIVDALGQGKVDMAAIGTLSYLQAHQKYGVRVIAAGLSEQGKAEYKALIITAANSNLHSLQDLKGKTFAFGADTSTQGHLIPLIMLDKAGIKLTDLAGYTFTGSHFDTANAVLSGRYAAGGIQDKLGRELEAKGLVRILAESENFPSSTISLSCQVTCKVENSVPFDDFRARVNIAERGTYPDVKRNFLPMLCNHCTKAPCIEVCPVKASYKREDGVVLIRDERCIGCGYCVQACPYNARYLDPNLHVAQKCTFCVHRIDNGLPPACVHNCMGKARIFGDLNDPNSEVSKLLNSVPTQVLKPEMGTHPNVFYIMGDFNGLTGKEEI